MISAACKRASVEHRAQFVRVAWRNSLVTRGALRDPSDQRAYQRYVAWCRQRNLPAAEFMEWRRTTAGIGSAGLQ